MGESGKDSSRKICLNLDLKEEKHAKISLAGKPAHAACKVLVAGRNEHLGVDGQITGDLAGHGAALKPEH